MARAGAEHPILLLLIAIATSCADSAENASPAAAGNAGAPDGGANATGGATAGDSGDAGAGAGATPCRFEVTHEPSSVIPTVGIVEWSVNLAGIESAQVDFGRDEGYGMTAPVDLDEPSYRTLLLGMTASSDYHFRIVVRSADAQCESDDFVLTTGSLASGIRPPSESARTDGEIAPGFIVTSVYGGNNDPGQIHIVNQDGELVWGYTPSIRQISRVHLAYDGKSLYARDANVQAGAGTFVRISMDGLEQESIALPTGHHDFTVTPDGGFAYIRKAEDNTCDDIVRRAGDGSSALLFHVLDAYPPNGMSAGELCHTNSLHYHADDDSFTFSDLVSGAYVKVGSGGELVWVLGGDASDFVGDGAEWRRQHGHHMLGPERILFFSNGDGEGAAAIEAALDLEAMTATRVWSYRSTRTTRTFGDVQRLPNGNTLVTYSNAGEMHEVGAAGELVRVLTWPGQAPIGYATHRPSLYGPPPPDR